MRFRLSVIVVAAFAGSSIVADDQLDDSKAIDKIRLLGGTVSNDHTLPGSPVTEVKILTQVVESTTDQNLADGFRVSLPNQRFTEKHVHLLSAFQHLNSLCLEKIPLTEVGLKTLQNFHSLTTLKLNGGLRDASLKGLRTLTNLTDLDLCNNPITNKGIKELAGLTNLTSLCLSSTRITYHGLSELKECKNLKNLQLNNTQITDLGTKEIANFKSLTSLYLVKTGISDSGLKELKNLAALETISLSNNQISDRGVSELMDFKNLTTLWLDNTEISDDGVKQLAGIKSLKKIGLHNVELSDEALQRISEENPELVLVR